MHTPKPWKVDRITSEIVAMDSIIVGLVFGADDFPCYYEEDFQQECEANARLIEAAPDLLHACRCAFAMLNRPHNKQDEETRMAHLAEVIQRATFDKTNSS